MTAAVDTPPAPPVPPAASPQEQPAVTVIRPRKGWEAVDFRELWRYRELLWLFSLRDVQVRYKQSLLGILWAVVRPVMTMVVFTAVFNRLAGINAEGVPYAVFAFAALLPWQFFIGTLNRASSTLVTNQGLAKKVYFPRLILPLSSALTNAVDFAVGFVVLVGLMFYYGYLPDWHLLLLPVSILLAMMLAMGVGLVLSAIEVKYRDVGHVLGFSQQIWMYATPVAYPLAMVPDRFRDLYVLNPAVLVVELARFSVVGRMDLRLFELWPAVVMIVTLFILGVLVFHRTERNFADIV